MTSMRPFVLLSAAMSLDGCLDDESGTRLILSNEEDMRQVRRLRGDFDAIMVGARTIRSDNPSLAASTQSQPRKVTMTATGQLDTQSRFFDAPVPPIVYCPTSTRPQLHERLNGYANVRPLKAGAGLAEILADLKATGIQRLMVEGGGAVHSQFLQAGLADALRLAVAPFFVGQAKAPRFTQPGDYMHHAGHRMRLSATEQLDDMAVLHYTMDNVNG